MMNKKVLLSSALILCMGGFFVYKKFIANLQNTTQFVNTKQDQPSASNTPPPVAVNISPIKKPKQTPTQLTNGLKNGTYNGGTVDSMYGPVQVQLVINSGQITDVKFLQYPSDRSASLRKSQMAMPIIKQEVIQSQSVSVNTVSGATETSLSAMQSMADAMSQAS